MSKQYFHFTIGPVQSFVGQARRTRDFWAGSFILSWLSGVAMLSVIKQDGIIIFPKADEKFLKAIKGKESAKPKQGSIPNRFKAKVKADFSPGEVVNNVQKAWKALANAVYEQNILHEKVDLTPKELEQVKCIWDRQIKHFWDISWVMVNDAEDSSALDRRKNFRSHYMPAEPGIKCSLMGDWQELSGYCGVSKRDNKKRKQFWSQLEKVDKADFKENEYLCAMALVKRRFVQAFAEIKVDAFHGWQLPKKVPSVSFIAAADWFAKVLDDENINKQTEDFVIKSSKMMSPNDTGSGLKCIDDVKHIKPDAKGLDGNVFHQSALNNTNVFNDQSKAQAVKSALSELTAKHGDVSPFYAILMMDGDGLGKQMSNTKKQKCITKGLQEFIAEVPKIVYKNNGFLIYAGGDDVLALVTLEGAMACANKIHKHYNDCFEDNPVGIETSISAAIIYAHIRIPLSNLLHDIHNLLDDVAKACKGKDALAVRVYKPGGIALQWVKKWQDAKVPKEAKEAKDAKDAKDASAKSLVIETIANNFKRADLDKEHFSSRFFYKIRQRFEILRNDCNVGGENNEFELSFEQSVQIMAMEYCKSMDNKNITMAEAKKIVEPLLNQCMCPINDDINVGGALLVKFLAQKGLEA